ncbi:MAG: helix-turn-helix domain-containing protein [Halieaceae bacterium]|jgi:hypothetical protein|nr:helix-turn-helix domain-containing protein [Halieaceae bacterium]
MAKQDSEQKESLLNALLKLPGQVTGGTLELARNTAAMTAMFGESWLRTALVNTMEPDRMEAMAEAGHFLRDARQTAGLSAKDVAASLGLSDKSELESFEGGETIMPLELMLRSASLLARHDPIPFLIKFMRTYNPALGQTLEQWGVLTLPRNYERERRFLNLYRQHDVMRGLSDEEFERFIAYMGSSMNLVLDVMTQEKAAIKPRKAATRRKKTASKAAKTSKKPTAGKRKAITGARGKT